MAAMPYARWCKFECNVIASCIASGLQFFRFVDINKSNTRHTARNDCNSSTSFPDGCTILYAKCRSKGYMTNNSLAMHLRISLLVFSLASEKKVLIELPTERYVGHRQSAATQAFKCLKVRPRLGPFTCSSKERTKASNQIKLTSYFIKNPNFELH